MSPATAGNHEREGVPKCVCVRFVCVDVCVQGCLTQEQTQEGMSYNPWPKSRYKIKSVAYVEVG